MCRARFITCPIHRQIRVNFHQTASNDIARVTSDTRERARIESTELEQPLEEQRELRTCGDQATEVRIFMIMSTLIIERLAHIIDKGAKRSTASIEVKHDLVILRSQ